MKKLETYFQKIQKADNKTPLFSDDELHQLVGNAGIGTQNLKTTSPLLKNIFIVAFGITLLAGGFWLSNEFFSQKQTETPNFYLSQSENSQKIGTKSKNDLAPTKEKDGDKKAKDLDEVNRTKSKISDRRKFESLPITEKSSDIPGIMMLALSADELEKLGIHRTDDGFEVITEEIVAVSNQNAQNLEHLGYDIKLKNVFVRIANRISLCNFTESQTLAYDSTKLTTFSKAVPIVLRTHFRGSNEFVKIEIVSNSPLTDSRILADEPSLFHQLESAKLNQDKPALFSLLSKLLPVHFRFGNDTASNEVVLWFAPTTEFIDLLPDRYRNALHNEIFVMNEVAKSCLTPQQACEAVAGKTTFFDVCKKDFGVITGLAIFPNPVRSAINCLFSLTQSREIKVNLHNLEGKFLLNLGKGTQMEAGEHSLSFPVEGFSNGVYLLVITSDKGEQAVQQIIIN